MRARRIPVAAFVACLVVALFCAGVADAGDKKWRRKESTRKSACEWWNGHFWDALFSGGSSADGDDTAADESEPADPPQTEPVVGTPSAPPRRGGIDPTTVPIVDDDLLFMAQATREQIRADEAHGVATGRGVVVAVLDGGFNLNHPAIAGNLALGYDAIDDDFDPHDTGNGCDDDGDGIVDHGAGHGTFVAGMVLLAAPDATIVPIRIRDDEGYGTNEETLRGLEYAREIGADVINLSITLDPMAEEEVLDLVLRVLEAGVPVVVSAGNDSTWISVKKLALSEFTLAVGAVDSRDVIAPFSNYALWDPMIYAPGVDLYGPIGSPTDDASGVWSGTSFAAGIISGAAALHHCVHPDCTPEEVYRHLRMSVDLAFNEWHWPLAGGRINLWKVVAP